MCKNLRNVSSPLPSGKSQRSPSSIITAQLAATLTRGTRREHPRVGHTSKKNHARAHTYTCRTTTPQVNRLLFLFMTSFRSRNCTRLLNHLPHSSLPSREDHEVRRGGGGSADIRPSVSLSTSSSLCLPLYTGIRCEEDACACCMQQWRAIVVALGVTSTERVPCTAIVSCSIALQLVQER